jgi:hypothetical protein
VNQSGRLDSSSFRGCHRKARQHVNCDFLGRGETSAQRVICKFKVSVEGTNENPTTDVGGVRCRTEPRAILRYDRAKQVMRVATTELAGKPTLLDVNRVSRLKFWGWAEWTRKAPQPQATESCYVEVTAELLPSGRLQVETRNLDCEKEPPPAT